MQDKKLELLFLGSGNAFAAQGRAFSSVLLDGRYLFDCGPTVLQQLNKAGIPSNDVEAVFISHFHADHFFGLAFLFLDSVFGGRTRPLTIVGPPGIREKTAALLELGYPGLFGDTRFETNYVDVCDGFQTQLCNLKICAAQVKHVQGLDCFAFRAELDGRSLVYSGDTTLCDSLLKLSEGVDVVVVECSCKGSRVHLSPSGVEAVARHAAGARVIVTHLDGHAHPHGFDGLIVADDLKRLSL